MDKLALPFEYKSVDNAGVIEGLAAAFGNVDFGGDRIMQGAFTKSLAARGNRPLPMLLHHDLKRPIGAWTELKETSEGLIARGRVTLASRDGAEAHALAKDGALTGLSIGYAPVKHVMSDGNKVRELHELALHEASLVAVPMNERTTLRVIKEIANVGDLRELLHDAGFSGRNAKVAAGAAWKAINDQSSEEDADAELAAILRDATARITGNIGQ